MGVNGDLAVSRAFGDAQHKRTGGPAQEDHPVSAMPELLTMECESTNFLMLVCDGISEGVFPNRDVIKLAAQKLRSDRDPGSAARAVCNEALRCNSKDNLSCMIVLFDEGDPEAMLEFWPGPFERPSDKAYCKAYEAMAQHASLSLPEALVLRYDNTEKELNMLLEAQANLREVSPEDDDQIANLRTELANYEGAPTRDSEHAMRTAWFLDWLEKHRDTEEDGLGMDYNHILRVLAEHKRAEYERCSVTQRRVHIAKVDELKPAVEKHPALKWDNRLEDICDQAGLVTKDDPSDGTSQVLVGSVTAWLPTDMLTDIEDQGEPADGPRGQGQGQE
eukprot:NODE_835_length_1348_cov_123.146172.p1 GENE.NODE_835_length_1348_cov_123.146172~~NODE_835_length_1348_cov_123.146172.p1  ORF type:complete len:334 (+),score=87.89 NODE_835_length_1348_cov_123.146172:3-1004(+)